MIPNDGVRPQVFAETWYPGDANLLRSVISRAMTLSRKSPLPARQVVGLLLPHAGLRYSAFGIARGLDAVGANDGERLRFVVLAPYHQGRIESGKLGLSNFAGWQTPFGDIPAFLPENCDDERFILSRNAIAAEHSVEMVMPFLRFLFPKSQLSVVVCPHALDVTDADSCALTLRRGEDPAYRYIYIASSDQSHYGRGFGDNEWGFGKSALEQVRKRDLKAAKAFVDHNPERIEREQLCPSMCGLIPALIVSRMFREARVEILSLYNSLDSVCVTAHDPIPGALDFRPNLNMKWVEDAKLAEQKIESIVSYLTLSWSKRR